MVKSVKVFKIKEKLSYIPYRFRCLYIKKKFALGKSIIIIALLWHLKQRSQRPM